MDYQFCMKQNFEDLSGGRVIYHRKGMPNYPVRLAQEVFLRAMTYLNKKQNIILYDPCCGNGYLVTILGLLNGNIISHIKASDIDEEALNTAKSNLTLLTIEGIKKRESHIQSMIDSFNKPSHIDALKSVPFFYQMIENRTLELKISTFLKDVLDKTSFLNENDKVDLIFTDVPYGHLVNWSNQNLDNLNRLLDSIIPILHSQSIVVISSDKSQKVSHESYKRLEKFKVGKRVIHIFKLGTLNNL